MAGTPPPTRAFDQRRPGLTRRAFLCAAGTAAALTGAAGLTSCRRQPEAQQQAPLPQPTPPGPTRPPLPAVEPMMRVRIALIRQSGGRFAVGEAGRRITLAPENDVEQVVLDAPLEIALDLGGWTVVDGRRERRRFEGAEAIALRQDDSADSAIRVGERVYPGTLRLVARSDSQPDTFDVINLVPLETYLPGVVAGELYPHWKFETRAAQAVAARSFACSEHVQFARTRDHDVSNTASSQVYVGLVKHRDTHRAVESTRGIVLGWDGRLVPGYYSACCGGLAATAFDAIGDHPANDVPPLEGHAEKDVCVKAEVARWTVRRPLKETLRRLRAFGLERGIATLAGLEKLAAVETAERNHHGRPSQYALLGGAGDEPARAQLAAERLRAALDAAAPGLDDPARPLWSSDLSVEVDRHVLTIKGQGLGHGAGLCQYGAEYRARAGAGHEEILAWYYPGAQLVRTYGAA